MRRGAPPRHRAPSCRAVVARPAHDHHAVSREPLAAVIASVRVRPKDRGRLLAQARRLPNSSTARIGLLGRPSNGLTGGQHDRQPRGSSRRLPSLWDRHRARDWSDHLLFCFARPTTTAEAQLETPTDAGRGRTRRRQALHLPRHRRDRGGPRGAAELPHVLFLGLGLALVIVFLGFTLIPPGLFKL
jgi:hypothetical protein